MTTMDFYSAYRHGFVRVAACTHHTSLAEPSANADSVLRLARECHDDSVALAIFPELTLSGYSIEDILMQDTLLDSVEDALSDVVAASVDLLPVLVVGAPLRYRHRVYNTAVVVHRGSVLGVVPKSYLPTYREFYERRQMAPGDEMRGVIRLGGNQVPIGPDLLFAAADVPGFVLHVEICGTAEFVCGTGGRHRAGESVWQPHHYRPRRGPLSSGPFGVGPLPCRLCLRRCG
jgi:NAD+ synthase (glutamine-hydrolysing)